MMKNNLKISKTSLSDKVYDQLKDMVLSGEWEAGDKLPSEQELSNMFGVSRLTTRIAIEKLNGLQILETRVGEGTFVKDFSMDNYISEVNDIIVNDEELIYDVSTFRTAIELAACEQIIERIDEVNLDSLYDLVEKMSEICIDYPVSNKTLQHIINEYVELDYTFHHQLCKCSGNKLIVYSYSMSKAPILQYISLLLRKRIDECQQKNPHLKKLYVENIYDGGFLKEKGMHLSILEALKAKDVDTIYKIHKIYNNYSFDIKDMKTSQ